MTMPLQPFISEIVYVARMTAAAYARGREDESHEIQKFRHGVDSQRFAEAYADHAAWYMEGGGGSEQLGMATAFTNYIVTGYVNLSATLRERAYMMNVLHNRKASE
jgi:hypothetical protein